MKKQSEIELRLTVIYEINDVSPCKYNDNKSKAVRFSIVRQIGFLIERPKIWLKQTPAGKCGKGNRGQKQSFFGLFFPINYWKYYRKPGPFFPFSGLGPGHGTTAYPYKM